MSNVLARSGMVALLLTATVAFADQFDSFRKVIDCFECYSLEQREMAIRDLEAMPVSDVEQKYLLGMLYFMQAVETAKTRAQSMAQKPRIQEVMSEPDVRDLFQKSEANYDAVEKESAGYKYIYCKYGELYRYWHNERGLRRTTVLIGRTKQNERTQQCKNMLEDVAEKYAQHGFADLSKAIYEEAVRQWKPYPVYMLEALGDIEQALKNKKQAAYWWGRCVKETDSSESRERCEKKRNT